MKFPTRYKSDRVYQLPVEQIRPNPDQPRRIFETEALEELAQSIRRYGILQPLTVRQTGEGYQLIAGERRLRAAALAGLRTVPCIFRQGSGDSDSELALLENLQRQDLDFFEEGEALARLVLEFGLTQEEISRRLGKSQSYVANKLRILRLLPEERQRVREAGLSERHVRALVRLKEPETRATALDRVIGRGLTVAATEELVEELLKDLPAASAARRVVLYKDVRIFVNTINRAVRVMKQSGIDAVCRRSDSPDCIEYSIKIPR